VEDGRLVSYLQGAWRLRRLADVDAALRSAPAGAESGVLDGSRLESIDTAAGYLLARRFAGATEAGPTVGTRSMSDTNQRLLALVAERIRGTVAAEPPRRPSFLARLGQATLHVARQLRAHAGFVGSVSLELAALIRQPRRFRPREAVSQFEASILDALPIAGLISGLIGVVFAYLLGVQARRYGATIFVVDGVGLAVCRELAPMLVAIIVAGRSGAAYTAQIGSMKVQEETDAIRILGLSPVQVLVVPRLAALVVGLPLLVFVGDLAGIAGGILVSAWQLGIPPETFTSRLHAVLAPSAVVIGLAKAPVFAVFIAMIACRMGMTVERDARSVGQHTTSTVVQSIVWVIVLDAAFAVALQVLGI
jgi:phospholipid/cholesterol/gamma-HCH transport system permease protein